VTVNLATGTGQGGHTEGDVLTDIEDLTGSAFADTLTGDNCDNRFDGGAGGRPRLCTKLSHLKITRILAAIMHKIVENYALISSRYNRGQIVEDWARNCRAKNGGQNGEDWALFLSRYS